jgi:pimeloyl-ACP methyl ester carboxylesterase
VGDIPNWQNVDTLEAGLFKFLKDTRLRWLLLLGFLVLLRVLLWNFEQRMTFAPTSEWVAELPDTATEMTIGEHISAAWFPVPDANFTIVYCHGNGGNISHRFAMAKHFQEMGWPVLLFDYRGYGKSTGGPPSEEKIFEDTQAVVSHAIDIHGGPIILYGRSLGTVAAIHHSYSNRDSRRGLILDSPLLSAKAMAEEMGLGWFSPLIHQKLDNEMRLPQVLAPTLILHGDADRIVPISHSRQLKAMANDVTTLVEIPGGRHNDSRRRGPALEALKSFIKEFQKP